MARADGSIIIDTKYDDSVLRKGLATLQKTIGTSVLALGAALAGAGIAATKVGMDFQSAMSQVAAISGATTEDLKLLSDTAKEMGATTKFTATESANALNYLALAGFDAQKSVEALPKILNLAAAGGLDLAYASDLVTDSMASLGLTVDDLEGFTDELAMTASKSNTSVAQLGEAILTVGGTAKMLSGGTVELNAALGILADNGIKASEGGTALRNVILSLTAPTDKAAAEMARLGVNAFDAQGNMKPLNDVMEDLNKALSTMTQQDKIDAMNTIFNKRDLKSVEALLGSVGGRFDELAGYIDDSAGSAERMAEVMQDNLKGQIVAMGSALEGLGIQIYESLDKPLRTAAFEGTKAIRELTMSLSEGDLKPSLDKIGESFGNLVLSITDFIIDVLPKIINGIVWLIDNGRIIIIVIGSLMTAMTAYKIATTGAIAVQTLLNAVMAANPIGLLVAALAALVAGLLIYKSTLPKAQKEVMTLADKTRDLTKAYEDKKKAIDESIAVTESEVEAAKELTEKLYELDKQINDETKSAIENAAAKEEMKNIAEELNALMPDIIIAFDNTTGRIITERKEVDTLIESYYKLAMAKAYQSKLDAAALTKVEAEENKRKSQQYLDEKNVLDPFQSSSNVFDMEARKAAFDTISGSNKLIAQADADMKRYIQNITEYKVDAGKKTTKTIEDEGNSIDGLGNKYKETGAIVKGVSETKTDAAKEVAEVEKETAKEIEKKEKELTKELENQRDKQFRDIKFYRDMGELTEEEYYNALEMLRNEYFDIDTDEWQAHTIAINNYKIKQAEEVKDNIKAIYKEITEMALLEIEEIKRAQDGLANKLKGYGQLFKETTTTIKGYGDNGRDLVYKTIHLGDLDKDIEDLKAYEQALTDIKDRGVTGDLFAIMRDMSVEEGLKFSEELLKITDEEFDNFIRSWETKQGLADEIAERLYSDDFVDATKKASDKAMNALTENYEKYGEDYAEAIGEGFFNTINDVFKRIHGVVSRQSSFVAQSIVGGGKIAFGGAGSTRYGDVSNQYSPTYNLYGQEATPAEATQASRDDYIKAQLRGDL